MSMLETISTEAQKILLEDNLSYQMKEEDGKIDINTFIPIGGRITTCNLMLRIYEQEKRLVSLARVPVKIDMSKKQTVLEYIARANYGLRIGFFCLNLRLNELTFKITQDLYEADREFYDHLLRVFLFMPPGMIRRYGDPLLYLLYAENSISAQEAITLAESNIKRS